MPEASILAEELQMGYIFGARVSILKIFGRLTAQKKSGKKAEVVARLVAAYAESGRVTAEQVQQPAPVGEGDDDTTIVEGQPDTHSGFAPDAQWPDATELEEAQLDEEQAIEARALTADPYELNEHDQLEEMRELMDQDEDPGDDFDF